MRWHLEHDQSFIAHHDLHLGWVDGRTWITVERDPRDHVLLAPGMALTIPAGHRVTLGPFDRGQPSVVERLVLGLKRRWWTRRKGWAIPAPP